MEEKKNIIDLANNNSLIRKITPSTTTGIDALNPIEKQDNQISFLNNDITSQKTISNSKNSALSKRFDRNGNLICKNGKQKVTFIDNISKNKLYDYIKVESFKKYNKMEETNYNFNNQNGCCLIE